MSGKPEIDSSDQSVQIIHPPNTLKAKVGGRVDPKDMAKVTQAENAINKMKSEFYTWLGEEVDKLDQYLKECRVSGLDSPHGEILFTCAHDLRGLGATYEYPIITRIAASMSRLIETPKKRASVPITLVEAHVNAVRAAIVQNIRSDKDKIGSMLASELEKQVVALVGEAQ